MNGLEYMNKICPTTSRGRNPNREDVADAFEDGYAEGYNQAEKDFRIKWKQKWSEEDVFRTKCLIESIKSGLSIRFELRDEFINWIESFKKRIGEQQ